MEKEIKNIDESKRVLVLKLSTQEIQPYYDRAYKEAQPKINMEGFRKGKVPINMIKKLYGKGIEADTDQDIVNEEFKKITQEENIQVLGSPTLTDIKKDEQGIEFTIEFETTPDIELNDYKGMKIDEPVHAVSDEEVDKAVEKILADNGKLEEAEEVTDEQFVVSLKMNEFDEESGTPIIGQDGKSETKVHLADENVIPELKEKIMNTKVGDTFEFASNPDENNPNIEAKKFLVTIKKIEKLIPAELTNEFVEEVSQGRLNTTEEMRDEVQFSLQDQWDAKSREVVENQIIEKLIAENNVPAPQNLVEQVMKAMFEDLKKKHPEELKHATVENYREQIEPNAKRSVQWELIRNEIIEKEDIELEEHDIDPIIEQEAQKYGVEKEQIKQMMMQNPNFLTRILSRKVIDYIIDFAIINEVDFETGEPIEAE